MPHDFSHRQHALILSLAHDVWKGRGDRKSSRTKRHHGRPRRGVGGALQQCCVEIVYLTPQPFNLLLLYLPGTEHDTQFIIHHTQHTVVEVTYMVFMDDLCLSV